MDDKTTLHFKNLLMEKRVEVLDRIERLREVAMESNYRESNGDHSGYGLHMADQGTDAMEREKAFLFYHARKNISSKFNKHCCELI